MDEFDIARGFGESDGELHTWCRHAVELGDCFSCKLFCFPFEYLSNGHAVCHVVRGQKLPLQQAAHVENRLVDLVIFDKWAKTGRTVAFTSG